MQHHTRSRRLGPRGFLERWGLVAVLLTIPACAGSEEELVAGPGSGSDWDSGSPSGGSGGVLNTGGSGGSGATTGTGGSQDGGCQAPPDTPVPEVCGNGLDDDLNGFIDEGCPCTIGQTQPCFGGPPSQASEPFCTKGTQTCEGAPEFPGWGACVGWQCGDVPPPKEICANGIDDDCDGQIDEGCGLNVDVNIDGDCVYASCPPQAPYPIACNIQMLGGDPRGCVANDNSALVYFQEGDACGYGRVEGWLLCSPEPIGTPGTNPLNEGNCAINKSKRDYPSAPDGCVPTTG
jgi:hypothetical protein